MARPAPIAVVPTYRMVVATDIFTSSELGIWFSASGPLATWEGPDQTRSRIRSPRLVRPPPPEQALVDLV